MLQRIITKFSHKIDNHSVLHCSYKKENWPMCPNVWFSKIGSHIMPVNYIFVPPEIAVAKIQSDSTESMCLRIEVITYLIFLIITIHKGDGKKQTMALLIANEH